MDERVKVCLPLGQASLEWRNAVIDYSDQSLSVGTLTNLQVRPRLSLFRVSLGFCTEEMQECPHSDRVGR